MRERAHGWTVNWVKFLESQVR